MYFCGMPGFPGRSHGTGRRHTNYFNEKHVTYAKAA